MTSSTLKTSDLARLDFVYSVLLLTCLCCGVLSVAAGASHTGFTRMHPDEFAHVDAIRFFTRHLWPPALNADGLTYQADGISRVYNGELYYYVSGWASGIAGLLFPSLFSPNSSPTHFRWFQVLLYVVTVLGLWRSRSLGGVTKVFSEGALIVLTCIPQVVYIYSYSNSDAWGVSWVLALTGFMLYSPTFFAKRSSSIICGCLIGMIVLCKPNFWLAVPFAFIPSLVGFWQHFRARTLARVYLGNTLLCVLAAFALTAPIKVIYPLTQGGFAAYAQRFEEMREIRSYPEFKPSNITAGGYRWKARGIPFSRVYKDMEWHGYTAKSFYAVFGYWTAKMTPRVYRGAVILGCAFFLLTLCAWGTTPWVLRWMIIASPAMFGVCYAASLYNSWTYDLQSQGRYLFGFLPALALLLSGGAIHRTRILLPLRVGLVAIAGFAAQFLLWKHLILNPHFWI